MFNPETYVTLGTGRENQRAIKNIQSSDKGSIGHW